MGNLINPAVMRLRRYTRGRRNLRFQRFASEILRPDGILRILDIGGTFPFWQSWWNVTPEDRMHITIVNNHQQDDTDDEVSNVPYIENWRVDAMTLTPQQFGRFDVIFSNSCVEHLGSWQDQVQMARRIVDSCLPYFVQVPNKYAPIDPHYPRPYVPFFACYPKPVQARLLTLSALGSGGRHTLASAHEMLDFYNPLGPGDMRTLFPDATLVVERPLGVPMSILAYRPSVTPAAGSLPGRGERIAA